VLIGLDVLALGLAVYGLFQVRQTESWPVLVVALLVVLAVAAWILFSTRRRIPLELFCHDSADRIPLVDAAGDPADQSTNCRVCGALCWPLLVVINTVDESNVRRRWVVPRDALPATEFRRLSVWLRTAHYGADAAPE
jgi:hypothetical protein